MYTKDQLTEIAAHHGLLLPDPDETGFVDLVRALGSLGGVADLVLGANAWGLADQIGAHGHIVFVLVDALGVFSVAGLPEGSFLRSHLVRRIRSVFPSTTACAMVSLATGEWPAQHGTSGWWEYLSEYGLSVTTLPFVERFTGLPLSDYGVSPSNLWPCPSLLERTERDVLMVKAQRVEESVFSRYVRGRHRSAGYESVSHAIDLVIEHIRGASVPTYTTVYFSAFDHACHVYGVNSEESRSLLLGIDAELSRLAESLDGSARIVVTGDHGQVDVPASGRLAIVDGDPLLDLLLAPPAGCSRVSEYHVRPGMEGEFVAAFEERFGDSMMLFSREEAECLRFFGPPPLSDLARGRFGDFVSVAKTLVSLRYYPPNENPSEGNIGHHSGMTADEMLIPVIVA